MIVAKFDQTYEAWRQQSRALLMANVAPEQILWTDQPALFESENLPAGGAAITVPKDFVALARTVALHRDPSKWPLLYGVLFRICNGERHLLQIESDPDVSRLVLMRKQIGHDIHRMHAFVRFREVDGRYVAWHRPDHLIVEQAAPWFVNRFGSMHWSILTPDRSAHWDLVNLEFGPGAPSSDAPSGDALEELWRAYYASAFNPARVNERLLRTHIPARHWATMPETALIPELVQNALATGRGMFETKPISGANFIPAAATLPVLRDAVQNCKGCDLYRCATQPVFGEGPQDARIVLVGEQPGDQEDREGRPFVGPSGQLLDRALSEAGLKRDELYITGAVKHFRYEERGKRRIHKTASRAQVAACQPWLEAELALIRPKLIVCLGATAVLSVLGRASKLAELRCRILPHRHAGGVTATVHPSFVLRAGGQQETEYARLVEDLRFARTSLGEEAA